MNLFGALSVLVLMAPGHHAKSSHHATHALSAGTVHTSSTHSTASVSRATTAKATSHVVHAHTHAPSAANRTTYTSALSMPTPGVHAVASSTHPFKVVQTTRPKAVARAEVKAAKSLQTEVAKTAKSASSSARAELGAAESSEIRGAIASGKLTPSETYGLQSDLATVRTHEAGSSESRAAISRIVSKLQSAGVSSETTSKVKDALSKTGKK